MERVEGLEIPQTLEEACHPERLALLAYDMQIAILRQIGDGESVTRGVREVLQAARAAGVRTVFVRHVTMPRRLMGAAQLRMWKSWQRRESVAEVVSAFPPGADHVRIAPEVEPAADEAVFDKVEPVGAVGVGAGPVVLWHVEPNTRGLAGRYGHGPVPRRVSTTHEPLADDGPVAVRMSAAEPWAR
jgi:Isochorismatase family